jgi:type IV secretory pathway TrbL component
MKKLLSLLALGACLSFGAAQAQDKAAAPAAAPAAAAPAAGASCEAKAVDKNGKALAGAAKNSFIKKCTADAAKA